MFAAINMINVHVFAYWTHIRCHLVSRFEHQRQKVIVIISAAYHVYILPYHFLSVVAVTLILVPVDVLVVTAW